MKKNSIKPSRRKLKANAKEAIKLFKEVKLIPLIWMYNYLELLMKECKAEIERRQNKGGK